MPGSVVTLLVALQQGLHGAGSPGFTTPPHGDTVGYWQQRADYTITATLDERAQRVRATGTLRYVNSSPDTLREMYFHQYLNAFRPASRWAGVDEREGRERFQFLQDPDYAYERFTAPVRVNGVTVAVEYPGAPDSTVARIMLPAPLAPRDSVVVVFAWDARPSTIPRRQGRRGRHWDMAQWYPKVAVYDRGGWQHNALQPAGEFYGDFGTYDVTLIVAEDQVVGATGVPVSGDPGWSRVIRGGVVRTAANAYDGIPETTTTAPPGFKSVRFYARDVHHFGWSASPTYRYEGGIYARALSAARFATWDTVSVHVLYRAGDDTTWGGQRVLRRTFVAMQWLEALYGPYAYPQMTVLHRLEGGGTEFPMMQMNGSASQGLILHEGGHVWTYGILANNEWRSAWMDEGLTSYQTAWAQRLTPLERVRAGIVEQAARLRGYRRDAIRMTLPRFEVVAVNQTAIDLLGRAQPIGTVAHEFRDFDTYNDMVYDRAEVMFSQLRDVLGDTLFVEFLRDYYARWALKHVDERAMRASAERASGEQLGWFFDQWIRRTGVMDYRLGSVRSSRSTDGSWVTEAHVRRKGEFAHPMPVGVRTTSGWTLARVTDEPYDRQTVRIVTSGQPLEVRLDPYHVSWDWDRRNDIPRSRARNNIDWPLLTQADRDRSVRLFRPMAWYSEPGGVTVGLRQRTNYLGWLDKSQLGVVAATRGNRASDSLVLGQRIQSWARVENPGLPFLRRPAIGWRAGISSLDDVVKTDLGWRKEFTVGSRSRVDDVTITYALTQNNELLPESWSSGHSADLAISSRTQRTRASGSNWFTFSSGVAGVCRSCVYAKLETAIGVTQQLGQRSRFSARAYSGFVTWDNRIPGQRALLLSAADPVSTFDKHWWRPRAGLLKQPNVNWLPLGGAALRGFHWSVSAERAAAANVEISHGFATLSGGFGTILLGLSAFGDGGFVQLTEGARDGWLVDAGPSLTARGRLFDNDVNVRFDFPVYVNRPERAIDRGQAGSGGGRLAPRWAISFNDIW